jgi:hypothetical protein
MIFGQNAIIAIIGSAAGLIAAVLAPRALASFLYETSPRDPWVFVGSVAALTAMPGQPSCCPHCVPPESSQSPQSATNNCPKNKSTVYADECHHAAIRRKCRLGYGIGNLGVQHGWRVPPAVPRLEVGSLTSVELISPGKPKCSFLDIFLRLRTVINADIAASD